MALDCSAVKRSLAESGTNLTLVASLKIAAAIARQNSTSRPVQLPLSSGFENPGSPWVTPHKSEPRHFTVLSVWADDGATAKTSAKATPRTKILRFMGQPLSRVDLPWVSSRCFFLECRAPGLEGPARRHSPSKSPHAGPSWSRRYLRTIGHRGQGVDACTA